MTSVLVANRGEIAIRVFRTAKRLGMRTVAVYSDADDGAPHVGAADVAVHIGPAPATESYLRADRIIDAAISTGAEFIHPGYGFLAEDDAFASMCTDAALIFVGPPATVLRAVGDKAASRTLAEAAGVPILPGYAGADQTRLLEHARRIGFPVLVKPASGGGGKGMAVVRDEPDFDEAVASARRIAGAAFGDERLILERYIEGPRHVEVQVFGDADGNVIHLGERDCSLQRRHQKIVEETPAPNLDAATRNGLHDAAVAFARHAGYVGAGTCEFLVARDGTFGFIEMNARLQVEHPVTEMVTGLDLVELQLHVAGGGTLPAIDASPNGHAIEVRVYAEDPSADFLPQAGRIEHLRWPTGVRVDAGVEAGTTVTTHYDPMLGKIVVHASDRPSALAAMQRAASQVEILGPRTNVAFLRSVLDDPTVVDGRVTTDWLDNTPPPGRGPTPPEAIAAAASAELARVEAPVTSRDPFSVLGGWRLHGASSARIVLRVDGEERVVEAGDVTAELPVVRVDDSWLVWCDGDQWEIGVGPERRRIDAGGGHLDSPLPGQVIAVKVNAGDQVVAGAELVVVEAMKMEHTITAQADGTVTAVLCAPGDQVARGQALVEFEAS